MILRAIRVENFRKLREPVQLADLPNGLVIVAGDNEAGKSTLFAALRAALFSKHSWSGDLVESYRPYGCNVAPQVEVEFEIAGQRHRVLKRFCQRKHCTLVSGGRRWEDDGAEAELARLLGGEVPNRPPREGDETGLEGPLALLWIKQGQAWSPDRHAARTAGLRALLEGEVGDVLGGPRADSIREAAVARRKELLTETGKPTGELKAVSEQNEALKARAAELRAGLSRDAATRAALAGDERRLRDIHAQAPEFQARLHEAETRFDQARQLALRHAELSARWSAAQERRKRLEAEIEGRAGLRREIERSRGERQAREQRRDAAAGAAARAAGVDAAAASRAEACAAALTAAEKRLGAVQASIKLAQAESELAPLQERLAMAREAQARQAELTREARLLPDAARLEQLQKTWDQLQQAEARLEAVATRVTVELSGGARATLDGRSLPATSSTALAQTARLEIAAAPGPAAAITIEVAGAAERLQARERCRQAWSQALAALGVANLPEARLQAARRGEAESGARAAASDFERCAPNGLEQLELDAETVRRRGLALQAAAEACAEPDAAAAEPAAQAAVRTLREAHSAATTELAVAHKELEIAQQSRREAEDELRRAADDATARQQALARQEEDAPDAQRAEELAAVEREMAGIAEALGPLGEQLDRLDRPRAEAEVDRARRAWGELERDRQATAERVARARGELAVADPWAESLKTIELDAEYTARRHGELERRAAALDLLCKTLAETRSAAEALFLGPILKRVVPLLDRLLPGTQLVLSPDMQVRELQRGAPGAAERFEGLSHGTREQIAILVRLAFARLLHDRGRPAMTILDDAPAFSDRTRFATMLEILDQSATWGQVFVLTCREYEFRPAGGHIARLERAGAAAG